jgi:hypothetical protein
LPPDCAIPAGIAIGRIAPISAVQALDPAQRIEEIRSKLLQLGGQWGREKQRGRRMLTTVYFATNRARRGPPENWQSYTASIVAPSDPSAIL